jgi:hypothetical protein
MPNSSVKQINKSIFADQCEVTFGKFLPHILPIESKAVQMTCENKHRQNIITCKDEFASVFAEEVDGLDFNIHLRKQVLNLPPYIPILDYRTAQNVQLPDSIEYIGITLRDIIKTGFSFNAGRLHETPNVSYRSDLFQNKNFVNKKIILFLTGEDTIIEGVWHKRNKSKLFETLRAMNFYAVTGFNFSVFGSECTFSQVLNLKRSLYSAYLLEQNKINPIPHIYALDEYQINRWMKWFKENPKVKYFTMNCQFQKSKSDIEFLIDTISYILSELPYIHIILQGFPFTKASRFEILLDRIHFAEKKAVKYSIGYKSLKFDTKSQKLLVSQNSKPSKKIVLFN